VEIWVIDTAIQHCKEHLFFSGGFQFGNLRFFITETIPDSGASFAIFGFKRRLFDAQKGGIITRTYS
jgi:hypothetical protein